MKTRESFDLQKFICPDVSCAPVYVWVWNDACTRETVDIQLSEMQRLGIRAFYILPEPKEFRPNSMPTNLTPEYLSGEYFALWAYAVEKGKTLDMNCWIYDEGGWPSGSACGRVVKDHPEFARQVLKYRERTVSGGNPYKKTTPDVLATFLQDGEILEDGSVLAEDAVVTEYVLEGVNSDYPDLLNEKATDYFIEITHKKYASALNGNLGKGVTAVFTDEVKGPVMPLSKALMEEYEAVYGQSILPHLPLLAKRIPVTEENVSVLHRWYDLCSRMFCEHYLLPCRKWAKENGVAFTGHLDQDHCPTGCMSGRSFNLMRALRCFDIPGIDVIWRQIYPENETANKNEINAYNGFFPRYASSAAAQNGTKLALSEIFGVAGPGLTYDTMRFTVGYQAVRGINLFNPFNFPLGRKGQLLAQELPAFTEKQVYYRYLDLFNRYTERLSYVSSLGERVCETALYYPVSDFQGGLHGELIAEEFDALGRHLEDKMVDFDIVDDDVIQNAEITDSGCMRIGSANYKCIILPGGAHIPQASQKALSRFIGRGGRVLRELSDLKPVVQADGSGLRGMHRKTENGDIFCLFRETGEKGDYTVVLPSDKGYLLDMEKGKLLRLQTEKGILKISLAIGETAVVLLTDEVMHAEDKKEFECGFKIANGFCLRKETELVCDENGFENVTHSEAAVPAAPGDWSCLIGSAYSGSCIYETTFKLPKEKVGKAGQINLGDVRFAASVYLNDRFLGRTAMSPHRLEIPADLLGKENKLRIAVTNTSANWYLHTNCFDRWKPEELSTYFNGEKEFAKDAVSGGLFGPVMVYTE